MKKILLVIIFILLFSGCSANYELDLTDAVFKEKISINETDPMIIISKEADNYSERIDKILTDGLYLNYYNNFIETRCTSCSMTKYNVLKNTSNGLGLNINADVSYDILADLTSFKSCFKEVVISELENVVRIESMGYFNCFDQFKYLDDVSISIKSGSIASSNADVKDVLVHTWNYNRSNYLNKYIVVEIANLVNASSPNVDINDNQSSSDNISSNNTSSSSENNITSSSDNNQTSGSDNPNGSSSFENSNDNISNGLNDDDEKAADEQDTSSNKINFLLWIIIIGLIITSGVFIVYKIKKNNKI